MRHLGIPSVRLGVVAVSVGLSVLGGCADPPGEERAFVFALDARTGAMQWERTVDAIALGQPYVDVATVIVPGVHMPVRCQFDVAMISVDARSGAPVSTESLRPVSSPFLSSDPSLRRVVADGVVYTSVPGRVTAAPIAGASVAWEVDLPAGDVPAMALGDSVVVVASLSDGPIPPREQPLPMTVTGLDQATGATRWTASLEVNGPFETYRLGQRQEMFAPVPEAFPVVSFDYVGTNVPYYGQMSVAVAGDRVYLPHAPAILAVLDLATGDLAGSIRGVGGPVTATDGIFIARRGDAMVGLDADGQELWSAPLPDGADLVRASANRGTVYVAVSGRYGGAPCPLD